MKSAAPGAAQPRFGATNVVVASARTHAPGVATADIAESFRCRESSRANEKEKPAAEERFWFGTPLANGFLSAGCRRRGGAGAPDTQDVLPPSQPPFFRGSFVILRGRPARSPATVAGEEDRGAFSPKW